MTANRICKATGQHLGTFSCKSPNCSRQKNATIVIATRQIISIRASFHCEAHLLSAQRCWSRQHNQHQTILLVTQNSNAHVGSPVEWRPPITCTRLKVPLCSIATPSTSSCTCSSIRKPAAVGIRRRHPCPTSPCVPVPTFPARHVRKR